ncbi:50S ribosomal protein L4 [Candidatus Peribacteria bacterium]|nr:50S ribosomal protein L4 [Candidatus Peribacteria bacterium]
MNIDLYTSTGTKSGTLALPDVLFGGHINMDLMHQAVLLQQSNRRGPIAHVKNRGEVRGSTKKVSPQKGTGRARRGPIRSPLIRGGGKAFGPRSDANFTKEMPKNMRHAALVSCLSVQAKNGAIVGLENYPETIKTKALYTLLTKLPVQIGRRILFVVPERHNALWISARNIPRIKVITAPYLNPEDVLLSKSIIFVADSVEKAAAIFGKGPVGSRVKEQVAVKAKTEKGPEKAKTAKRTVKKTSAKASSKKSSSPSSSSQPS